MRTILCKFWNLLTSPFNKISNKLSKFHLWPFDDFNETKRVLGFSFISIILTFVVYFTSNSDLAWTIFLGGGQIYSFLHEGIISLMYGNKYRPELGFLGIIGIAFGVFIAFLLYMIIFGFGGAILNQFK